MGTSQDISREIAIYEAMLDNDGFTGQTYRDARTELRKVIIRPVDIHIVENMAKKMQGTMLLLEDGRLRLNIERAHDRLEELVQRLSHPSHKDIGDPLKNRIRELHMRLSSQLALV